MSLSKPTRIVDRKDIPADPNAYVFRDAQRNGTWCLYFYDREVKTRHRIVLKDGNGKKPKQTTAGQDDAWMLGISKYVELKGKADRGEAIRSITFAAMCDQFIAQEKRKISSIPHQGITQDRFRLISHQINWLRRYLNNDNKQIHTFRTNAFSNYEVWRKEQAIRMGKTSPVQTTIMQELSMLKRAFREVGVANGYVAEDSLPKFPKVKLPKDQSHRRDDLSNQEWEQLERAGRNYWIKGRTRLLDGKQRMEKDSNGKWKTKPIFGHNSERGKRQIIHRNLIYYAMRVSMDTGIRPGALRKMKWKHISENTTISQKERKIWVIIDVPPENSKTGRYYRISAPVARYLEKMRKVTQYKKADDFLFSNQLTGQPFSERIWKDGLTEVLVESRLADWGEDDSNNLRKVDIHSGKNITWYSFRHSYITMRLKAGVPVPVIAANTDTSMKYIQTHYFHYRADESTEILGKGRNIRPAEESLQWARST
tara:strand:+ start:144 stop:1589 length:1446 start_codon:yes stop_codon:yes gene_type:complete